MTVYTPGSMMIIIWFYIYSYWWLRHNKSVQFENSSTRELITLSFKTNLVHSQKKWGSSRAHIGEYRFSIVHLIYNTDANVMIIVPPAIHRRTIEQPDYIPWTITEGDIILTIGICMYMMLIMFKGVFLKMVRLWNLCVWKYRNIRKSLKRPYRSKTCVTHMDMH